MHTLTATYSKSRPKSRQRLIIEQEKWAAYTGALTRYSAAAFISNLAYGTDLSVNVNCGFVDGAVATLVHVYPLDLGRDYRAHLSWGTLGEHVVEEYIMQESINFAGARQAPLKYPARKVISLRWQGQVFDQHLDPIPPPSLRTSGGGIQSAEEAYGTVLVSYETVRHNYTVRIGRRENAEENKYSSVFYAVHDGGVDHLVLSEPPAADDLEGDCASGGGGSVSIEGPDPGSPNYPEPGGDRETVYDYCTGKLISDDIYGV